MLGRAGAAGLTLMRGGCAAGGAMLIRGAAGGAMLMRGTSGAFGIMLSRVPLEEKGSPAEGTGICLLLVSDCSQPVSASRRAFTTPAPAEGGTQLLRDGGAELGTLESEAL